jgi:hypothetical protein
MPGPLLAGVALCAALIMVAALVEIRGWRRGDGPPPAPARAREAAAGPAMARHELAIVPGFGDAGPPRPRRPGAGAAGAGGAPAGPPPGPPPPASRSPASTIRPTSRWPTT